VLTHTRHLKSRQHDLRYRTHQKQASLSLLDSRVEDIGSYEITHSHKNLRVCSHPATGMEDESWVLKKVSDNPSRQASHSYPLLNHQVFAFSFLFSEYLPGICALEEMLIDYNTGWILCYRVRKTDTGEWNTNVMCDMRFFSL